VDSLKSTSAATRSLLPCRFVVGVLSADPTELLVLHTTCLLLLILRGGVVAVLALRAFQRNNVSHSVLR
jgi:hypothetical protein